MKDDDDMHLKRFMMGNDISGDARAMLRPGPLSCFYTTLDFIMKSRVRSHRYEIGT